MNEFRNWRPIGNRVPDNHIRIEFDTIRSVSVMAVTELAMRLGEYLAHYEFEQIELVHAGRGSTTLEFSVEEQQAAKNVEKTEAEIAKIKADTRFTYVKIAGLLSPLLLAGASIAQDVASGQNDLAVMAGNIVEQGAATLCRITVGESCFEIAYPQTATNVASEKGKLSTESNEPAITTPGSSNKIGRVEGYQKATERNKYGPFKPLRILRDDESGINDIILPDPQKLPNPKVRFISNDDKMARHLWSWLVEIDRPPQFDGAPREFFTGSYIHDDYGHFLIVGPDDDDIIHLAGFDGALPFSHGQNIVVLGRRLDDGSIYPEVAFDASE